MLIAPHPPPPTRGGTLLHSVGGQEWSSRSETYINMYDHLSSLRSKTPYHTAFLQQLNIGRVIFCDTSFFWAFTGFVETRSLDICNFMIQTKDYRQKSYNKQKIIT